MNTMIENIAQNIEALCWFLLDDLLIAYKPNVTITNCSSGGKMHKLLVSFHFP